MALSELQKKIVNARGKVVVKACPGSGKTYSVAARIADLLKKNEFNYQGIAAISFTNTASMEIDTKLQSDFGIDTPLGYPHFVGTIDSFLNQYVFLPYGHLEMNCNKRPEIVGEYCHNRIYWEKKRKYGYNDYCTFIDPIEHFERVSFDMQSKPINIGNFKDFNFSWNKIYKNDGNYIKRVQEIVDSKFELFNKGYANQSDANYFSLKVLQKYPAIAKNIVSRFPYFIMDEAQDTNDIQMAIIDILVKNGLRDIMLIGDPDQAIFEWNNAKPKLFIEKYKKWFPLTLNENRRSSRNICKVSNAFIGYNASNPCKDSDVIDFKYIPEVKGIENLKKTESEDLKKKIIYNIVAKFLKTCKSKDIPLTMDKIAVLYRSKSYSKYFDEKLIESKDQPWKIGAYYLRDIIHGKFLIDNGEIQKGFKLIQQGYFRAIKHVPNVTHELIQKEIDAMGFVSFRRKLYNFIKILPTTKQNLCDWFESVKASFTAMGIYIDYNENKSIVPINQLFVKENYDEKKYYYGTIHSVKGRTFDAVLILLGKMAGNAGNYRTLFSKKYDELESNKQEELRIVYVALTRSRKILEIAVPDEDCEVWKKKLCVETKKS